MTGAGTPIFRLAASGRNAAVIKIGVADKDVIRLRLNDDAEIRLDAYANQVFAAYVSEIAEAADPRTGVFEVELTLRDSPKNLKNGFIGKVSIFPGEQAPYYKINMNALVEGNVDRANIYIPVDGKAQKVSVQPQHIGPDYFTVDASSVPPLKRVITDGAAYLKDGEPIRLMEEEQQELVKEVRN